MAARNGRGFFTKQIRNLQRQFEKVTNENLKETRSGDLVVGRHEKLRGTCAKCGKNHSANDHRFHGDNAHLRTHGDTGENVNFRHVPKVNPATPRKPKKINLDDFPGRGDIVLTKRQIAAYKKAGLTDKQIREYTRTKG